MGGSVENTELKRKYFPGSQMWFDKGTFFGRDHNLRGFGCGVVACLDFCVYTGALEKPQGQETYKAVMRELSRKYFPIMPGLGIAPYYYPILLNRYFVKKHFPYRVKGSFSYRRIDRLKELINRDLPVIVCVGPTLPFLFKDRKIPLYFKASKNAPMVPDRHSVRAHYMTVTGICTENDGETFLKVATWGEFLYMKLSDYAAYSKFTFPFTNRFYCILPRYIKK